MRCRRALGLASRAIDEPLSGADAGALAAHLAGCEACRLASGRLHRAWDALAPLGRVSAAPDDWQRIEARLEARSRWWRPGWEVWPAALRPAAAWGLAGMVALGATGGALLSRAALAPAQAPSLEASAFAETLGDLPWESPAAGLARPFLAAPLSQGKR